MPDNLAIDGINNDNNDQTQHLQHSTPTRMMMTTHQPCLKSQELIELIPMMDIMVEQGRGHGSVEGLHCGFVGGVGGLIVVSHWCKAGFLVHQVVHH